MSDIKIKPSATGSATVTLTAPATGTARTVTLPDSTGTLATTADNGSQLDHSGSKKIEAVSAGAAVTGNLTTTGNISTGNNGMVFILDSAGQTSGRIVTDSSAANALEIGADPNNQASGSYTAFRVDNTERMRITPDGLTFNGDTAAANALDDYEEGTWTPTAGGGLTGLTKTDCFYTKIGNMVHLQGRVSGFTGINSSTLYFGGLPFNPQYSTSNALVATTFVDLDQGYQLWCHLSHGEPKIYFRYMMNNAQYASLAGSDVSSSSNMYFNATYTVA